MKRLMVIALVIGASIGCQQNSTPTTAPASPPEPQRKTDVHIDTPKAHIDVHGRGTGR